MESQLIMASGGRRNDGQMGRSMGIPIGNPWENGKISGKLPREDMERSRQVLEILEGNHGMI